MTPITTKKFLTLLALGAALGCGVVATSACRDDAPAPQQQLPRAFGASYQDAAAFDGSAYLVNGVTVNLYGQTTHVSAGELVSDPTIQRSLLQAGGVLGPSTDSNLAAAAYTVQKMRSHGANEVDCSLVMMSAYSYTAYNYVYDAGTPG